MDVERTIGCLLEDQPRFEARFAKAEERLSRMERIGAQNNRLLALLAPFGASLRSEVRRIEGNLAATDANPKRVSKHLHEVDIKLNCHIDLVSQTQGGDGRRK